VLDRIKNNKGAFGFNAATEIFEGLMKAGIVGPTKVVRTALQNAASVAGLLLTTEAMVAEKPEEKSAMPPMPPGGGMGGMGGMMYGSNGPWGRPSERSTLETPPARAAAGLPQPAAAHPGLSAQ